MNQPQPAREIDELRRRNQALDEQVKLLVQIEQRLYRSQNELDAQVTRVRTLTRFALESTGFEAPMRVLDRALDTLSDSFALDWIGVLAPDAVPGHVTLLREHGVQHPAKRPIALDAAAWQWLHALREPVFVAWQQPHLHAAALRIAHAITPTAPAADHNQAGAHVAIVPIATVDGARPGWLVGFAKQRLPAFLCDGGLDEQHLPFLQLVAQHADHAIANALLNENLREHSARLAQSLATLANTQQLLIQSQKLEAMGRLAGGVAHDFNNLLTIILGYASDLSSRLPQQSPEHDHAQSIVEAARRAGEITAQLLAIGRRQIQRRIDFDLSRQVAHTTELLRRVVGEHIAMETQLQPDLHAVHADLTQIEQVLINLALNARDAMPRGGVLRIVTRSAGNEDRERTQGVVDPARYAALEVIDTGTGIDPATRALIFEPFFTTKPVGAGSGLGLAVVYGIVKQSDGHILVDSQVNRGSRFTVLLPLADAARQDEPIVTLARPAPSTPTTARSPARTILLVEDEQAILAVVAATLRAAGHHVVEARHGAEALGLLRDGRVRPDLVLTDVVMPLVGGRKLAEEVRRRRPSLPVAFMSGYAEDIADDEIGSHAAPALLRKPFTPQELLVFVEQQMASESAA